jgi:hypothetical protein
MEIESFLQIPLCGFGVTLRVDGVKNLYWHLVHEAIAGTLLPSHWIVLNSGMIATTPSPCDSPLSDYQPLLRRRRSSPCVESFLFLFQKLVDFADDDHELLWVLLGRGHLSEFHPPLRVFHGGVITQALTTVRSVSYRALRMMRRTSVSQRRVKTRPESKTTHELIQRPPSLARHRHFDRR